MIIPVDTPRNRMDVIARNYFCMNTSESHILLDRKHIFHSNECVQCDKTIRSIQLLLIICTKQINCKVFSNVCFTPSAHYGIIIIAVWG